MKRRWGPFAAATSWVLVSMLTLGFPGPGLAAAAASARASAGGLSVETDPAGATVYVDGQMHGETPVSVEKLTPGDHRVRVVKGGYLENSRVVSVQAGQKQAVQVRLTPDKGQVRQSLQVEEGGKKGGGGSKKGLWIGLGVVAAGAGAFLALRSTNKPPTAGTISVSPTGTGMVGATTFTFTSNASDPDGDPLTYTWNFGDGATGSGATASHVYGSAGNFQVSVSVSDGKKSATAPGVSVTVARNLAGSWTGGRVAGIVNAASVDLSQSGGSLSGSFIFAPTSTSTGGSSGLSGSVSPLTYPCNVNWSTNFFGLSISFNGSVDGSGNRMSGTINASFPGFSSSGTTTFSR